MVQGTVELGLPYFTFSLHEHALSGCAAVSVTIVGVDSGEWRVVAGARELYLLGIRRARFFSLYS